MKFRGTLGPIQEKNRLNVICAVTQPLEIMFWKITLDPLIINEVDFKKPLFCYLQKLPIRLGSQHWACPYCNRKFKAPSHVQRHILVHTGEKPYGCTLCDYTCQQSSHLKSHMNYKHPQYMIWNKSVLNFLKFTLLIKIAEWSYSTWRTSVGLSILF